MHANANSEKDAEKIRHEANQCFFREAPPPSFRNQNANAELEQPLATFMMQFKTGDYTFEETFIMKTQALRRQHKEQSTSQGLQITMALRDEMQKYKLKPITIRTEN